ncbi:MAG: hypothetical protein ABL966_03660 [Acidimicrobiales bacterium]
MTWLFAAWVVIVLLLMGPLMRRRAKDRPRDFEITHPRVAGWLAAALVVALMILMFID